MANSPARKSKQSWQPRAERGSIVTYHPDSDVEINQISKGEKEADVKDMFVHEISKSELWHKIPKEQQEKLLRGHDAERGRSLMQERRERIAGLFLFDKIKGFIRRFIVLDDAQLDVICLWVMHTRCLDAAQYTPYLRIHAPMKRSGKSRLLEVLELLVPNPWRISGGTAAALRTRIDREHPTLLLDESDATFNKKSEYTEDLRAILNSGFERDGKFAKCMPPDWTKTKDFNTFCPKAIAGIGGLPSTVEDRSISIELKRKLKHETVERFRRSNLKDEAGRLNDESQSWATANLEKLKQAKPTFPRNINDRQEDIVEPLLAIAELLGENFAAKARLSLVKLCNNGADEPDIFVQLLSDIKSVFDASGKNGKDKLKSTELISELVEPDDSLWKEYKQGKQITPPQLSALLKPLHIGPKSLRGQSVFKGYERQQFDDAWARYL